MKDAAGLKSFISFSAAGHIAVLSLLSFMRFSFSYLPGPAVLKPVVYCQMIQPVLFPSTQPRMPHLIPGRPGIPEGLKPVPVQPVSKDSYYKPPVAVSYIYERDPASIPAIPTRIQSQAEPGFMLHPLLPYPFDLYFKDRQAVHIELEFSITQSGRRNLVSLRRKVSSGNLEADLLSMRYIGHYLFIQQARFMPARWQTVKIEFSPNTR